MTKIQRRLELVAYYGFISIVLCTTVAEAARNLF